MELNSIKNAFDGVIKKQNLSSLKRSEAIEQMIHETEQKSLAIQSTLNGHSFQPNHNQLVDELKIKYKEMKATKKELNMALNKFTKLLEKHFNPDISKSYRHVDFDTITINQIIASHFYREGSFDIGDCFVNETCQESISSQKRHFLEIYEILELVESIKSGDLEPALKWVTTNHEQLQKNGSDIELKLHRLKFMKILQQGSRNEALKYGRTHFSSFATQHFHEIQKLMACVLWVGKLDSSPYSEFLSPTHWAKLAHELAQQLCNLLGQSYNNPLRVTVAAGVQGLPILFKLVNLMSKRKQEWLSLKHLPVPVDFGMEFQFHSVFVCPVSRDQASDNNPPMLMSCGHVLCKQSITKLSRNNIMRPFKCPYCPSEIEVGRCRQLYF